MNFKIILSVAFATVAFTQCKKGCTDSDALNYDESAKKSDNSCKYKVAKDDDYPIPSTYTFTDENGNNTVSFTGQAQRLDMLSEMSVYMKTANSAGTAISATDLKNMYSNSGYSWTDANNLGLNSTSKQLKDKTAYGTVNGSADAGIQMFFENYMDTIATLSATTTTGVENGAPGSAGVWPNDGVKGPYLMDENGVEYMQIIEKGLMSAVFVSQTTVHYLGTLSDDDNSTAVDPANGKYYTEMEHHWDEAYGYFTTEIDFPTSGTNRFWGKYSNLVDPVIGSNIVISEAFRTGRAAISNDDMETRDAQITILRNEIERIQAGTVLHYLNAAKSNITNATARNHFLSEAYAFLWGMQFGHNAVSNTGMTQTEIATALSYVGYDYNNLTITEMNTAIDYIASKTGLTDVKDNL